MKMKYFLILVLEIVYYKHEDLYAVCCFCKDQPSSFET